MHKRIIIPVLLAISLLFTSCSDLITVTRSSASKKNTNRKNSIKIDKTKLDDDITPSPYYDTAVLSVGYNELDTDDERRLYNGIIEHSSDFTSNKKTEDGYEISTFTLYDCYLEAEEVAKVFFAVDLDNPSLFWLANPYSYSYGDGEFSLTLYSNVSYKRYSKCRRQLNSVVNSVLKGLVPDMTELERELYIHDYIVKNCVYEESDKDFNLYTAYGALINQKAVCEGYTKAFQLLLSYAGVSSFNVNGSVDNSDNIDHIWSAVKLGGRYYYTDVTWDDTDDIDMYDYFNLTTKQLLHSHSIAPLFEDYISSGDFDFENMVNANLVIPDCTATKYNYYRVYGSHLKDISKNNLAEDLADAAENGEACFYIYVDPKLNFNIAYDQLFSDQLFLFKNYIYEANSILGYDTLAASVSVAQRKWLRTIMVELNYN